MVNASQKLLISIIALIFLCIFLHPAHAGWGSNTRNQDDYHTGPSYSLDQFKKITNYQDPQQSIARPSFWQNAGNFLASVGGNVKYSV